MIIENNHLSINWILPPHFIPCSFLFQLHGFTNDEALENTGKLYSMYINVYITIKWGCGYDYSMNNIVILMSVTPVTMVLRGVVYICSMLESYSDLGAFKLPKFNHSNRQKSSAQSCCLWGNNFGRRMTENHYFALLKKCRQILFAIVW